MKNLLLLLSTVLLMSSSNASTSFSEIFDSLTAHSASSSQSRIETLPIVTLRGKHKAISLNHLDITVKIAGPIAQTSYEMVFYNPNNRILEGELKLPLLDGQSVVGYALDIDGAYRESVVVDKAKAKKVFENTIRQNIDPGIIEKTVGNNYKLRLYPIPAKGYKRVKITIEELLHDKEDRYQYTIPFVSTQKIPDFSLHIEIASADVPMVKLSGPIEGEQFDQRREGYFLDYQKSNIKLKKPIAISIEKRDHHKVYFQKNPQKNHNWFMVILPKEKSIGDELIAKPNKYETLELIWDTSLSSESRDRAKELKFLDRFFAEHKDMTYRVELKTIDISMHSYGSYRIVNGEWGRLRKQLETFRYNGAKDFSKLQLDKRADHIFLFSNGINTFSDSVSITKDIAVVAISSTAGSDTDTLRYIASASGGKYLDLSQMEVDDALKKLSRDDGFSIKKHSKSVYDTYAKSLGDSIIVLGRVRGNRGTFTYSMGDQEYQIEIADAVPSHLISRVWANARVENLSMRYKKNKKSIIALSQKYKIVTRYTSMIVLDRVEDYLRYEIVPPRSLQKRYYALLKEKKREKRSEKKRAIEESIDLLKEEKKWYRAKYPIKRSKYEDETDGMGGDILPVVSAMEASVVASPSPSSRKQKKKSSQSHKPKQEMTINLKEWNSNASYIQKLKGIPKDELIDNYFVLRAEHKSEPSFYVDMADYFQKKGLKKEALLILSNLLELDFENSEFIRVFAFKLMEYHRYKQAIFFFQKVRELRPFELQSTRDLALAYERVGKYQTALNLHYYILAKIWDGRFSGAKIVTINELNHLITKYRLNTASIDRRLIARMPVDIRIVINWSTDNTDMDLWVIDPKEEKTYYGNRTSRIGGKISNDMTRGYGPEEFLLKKALRGKYTIKVKYYGTSQQKLTGPTVIRAEVYTNYGKKSEERQEIVFRVEEEKEVIDLGEIVY